MNNLRTKKRSFLDEIRNNKKYEQTKPTQILNIYLNFFKKTGIYSTPRKAVEQIESIRLQYKKEEQDLK